MRWGYVVMLGLILSACSGDKNEGFLGNACEGGPSEGGCGTACRDNVSACANGLYCASDGVCHADCSTEREIACGAEGLACASNGRCVDFGTDGDEVCGNVKITGANVKPNAMLIVDQSGSMTTNNFGSETRWDALRSLLIGPPADRPSGLVYDLQDQVKFGFASYSARAGDDNKPAPGTVCPMLNNPGDDNNAQSILAFQPNHYDAIRSFYEPAGTIAETPTGDAVTEITSQVGNVADYDDPVIFLLATDGEPDRCEQLNPGSTTAKNEVIQAVTAAFTSGIKTFVIAIGNEVSSGHAQDVAAAGQGLDPEDYPDKDLFYRPSTADALETDLQNIIRGERPCTFTIDGEIKDLDRACEGSVRLFTEGDPDGQALVCDDANGWRAVDGHTVEIRGQACADYRSSNNATVEGVFPCGVASGPFVF
ncbi:MAG: VWA domain-containing protein [Myxococcales bacterium]|nr:VWA domain-containing protein [Myxococcales bacterium]MCB9707888.1 VWA domain-containing protein [Myxococcales bacterium]